MTWTTPAGTINGMYTNMLEQNHLFIGGVNGGGKSVLINALIYTALYKAPSEVGFILCDPKMVELNRYENLPHVLRYADTLDGIDKALQHAHKIMMDRFTEMKQRHIVEYDGKDIYVIVDECSDLLTKGADRVANGLRKSCESSIESIGKLGRAAHVRLILATQSPNRQTIKANIINNMTARVALRCMFAIESKQIIGTNDAINLPDPRVEHRAECYYMHGLDLDWCDVEMIPAEEITARIDWWMNQVPSTQPAQQKRPGLFRRLFGAA